jgi:DNA-binding transcriptional LysR family regulator
MDWDDLRHFLAVHRTGSLARAAAELGVNATTVSRRLSAFEERLGGKLFDRTPDGYTLTAIGERLVPRAERMEEEALAIERDLSGADERLAGTVRVTSTEMLATRFVAPYLERFRQRYPDITLELQCTPDLVSLARREADVALRLARPREEDLVCKRLADIPLALYASHAYVATRGMPASAEASLAGHDVLAFASTRHFEDENAWMEARMDGARVALRSDSVSSIYSACVGGLGIALLPRAVADVDPALVRVPTESGPTPRVIWRAVHRDLKDAARIRVVCQFLERILAPRA